MVLFFTSCHFRSSAIWHTFAAPLPYRSQMAEMAYFVYVLAVLVCTIIDVVMEFDVIKGSLMALAQEED